MSKRTTPPPPPSGSFWLPFAICGLLGGLLGAVITYLALRPSLSPSPLAAALPAALSSPTDHLPDPALTAGQAPAQADRTLGNFYYDHQNWPQAVQHYEAAIRQGSDDADIRTDLGNAYRFSGRPDDALAQYERAQLMNPAHEFSLFNQGGLYLEAFQQPAKAVEKWQEYLVRFPQGTNAAAARQLIAQTQAGGATPLMPGAPAMAPSSTIEDTILQRIQAGQSKGEKPQ